MARAAKVLVVEDSATQALQIRRALEEADLDVECAASAEAALEALNHGLPNLVVTDYRLPGMLGDELCRKIRMNVNTRGIPILMLTSEQESGTERHVLESGADDYVSKSEQFDFVLLRIQALLRKSWNVQTVVHTGDLAFSAAKLLLVEDSPAYLEFLASALGSEGYRIETAKTGAEALERLAMESFDGIVVDLVLPDMSGADVCRKVAGARRTLDDSFVILALTASDARDQMTSVLAAGADDVVEKSRDIAVTKARLRALLRRKLIYEENQHIAEEFRGKELEILRTRAEKEVALARAALVEQLEKANRELMEAQAQLVQSAKMASLGQLVAGIAHEINNPVAFVLAHLQTVMRLCDEVGADAGDSLLPVAAKRLAKIRQRLKDSGEGLERVRDLVLKLRTFSRLDEGEFKVSSVRENVEAVLTMLRHRTKDRIKLECRLGEPDRIGCYPGLLNQALMNIVSNSIDAIEGEGEILITSGANGEDYEIVVQDTGKGISASARERVFEPFFTTKPVGEGTGLGMSITYQIVRKHGGSIAVESEEGRGTRMVIRLPLGAPPADASNEGLTARV